MVVVLQEHIIPLIQVLTQVHGDLVDSSPFKSSRRAHTRLNLGTEQFRSPESSVPVADLRGGRTGWGRAVPPPLLRSVYNFFPKLLCKTLIFFILYS